jgi:hypothetical protein
VGTSPKKEEQPHQGKPKKEGVLSKECGSPKRIQTPKNSLNLVTSSS